MESACMFAKAHVFVASTYPVAQFLHLLEVLPLQRGHIADLFVVMEFPALRMVWAPMRSFIA